MLSIHAYEMFIYSYEMFTYSYEMFTTCTQYMSHYILHIMLHNMHTTSRSKRREVFILHVSLHFLSMYFTLHTLHTTSIYMLHNMFTILSICLCFYSITSFYTHFYTHVTLHATLHIHLMFHYMFHLMYTTFLLNFHLIPCWNNISYWNTLIK